jgi:hypothetical protein
MQIDHSLSYKQQQASVRCRLMARYLIGNVIRYRLIGRHDKAAEMWANAKAAAKLSKQWAGSAAQ